MLKNINIAAFTAETYSSRGYVQYLMEKDGLTLRQAVRQASDESVWRIKPAAEVRALTMQDHADAFRAGAWTVSFDQRATEKQCAYLGQLAFEAGDTTLYSGHLTKRAASNLINDYLKG